MRYPKMARLLTVFASAAVAVALSAPAGAQQQTPTRPAAGQGQTQTNETAPRRGLDAIEVRKKLEAQGYTNVTNVDFVGEVHDDHFVAEATKNGQRYRLKIDDDYGRILSRTALQ